MKAIFAFGLLILFAFLGSRFLFKKRFFSPVSYFFLSGIIYIFLGLFLGKKGLNVLSPEVLRSLSPLLNLGLGWVGFLFGFQLEYKYIRRFPKRYIGLSFLYSFFVIFLATVALILLLKFLFPSQPAFLLYGMIVALALLVSISSPSLLNFVSSEIPKKGRYYYLARFLVSVSGFWAIAGLAIISSFWHFPFFKNNVFSKGMIFFLFSTIIPVFLGLLFHVLTVRKTSGYDYLVYLLGLVFFAAGAASYFNLPSLFICMVMGITLSNLTKIQEKLYPLLLSTEKPFYIIFLILIGALWEFNFDYKIGLLVILLLFIRAVAYTFPLRPLGLILRFSFPLPAHYGLCFLSFGGVALAFVVSLKLIYQYPLTDVFVSAALLVIVVSDLLSPLILKKALLKLESRE